jgi:hypothetical protein
MQHKNSFTSRLFFYSPFRIAYEFKIKRFDESGEDYLYPSKLFTQVELPPRVHRAVLKAA